MNGQHMRVNTVQPRISVRAGRNARVRARAFTLLELMVVLVLVLAVAALVVPAVALWFGTFHNDQIRAQVAAYAEDQLLESMRSGRPRVLWISGQAQQERARDVTSSTAPEPSAAATTPRAARWSVGCRVLSDIEPDSSEAGVSASALTASPAASATSSGVASPTALAPAGVELPAGWGLSLAAASKRPAQESDEETQAQPDLASDGGRVSQVSEPAEPVDAIVFWPTGQMDVLHQLEITEPDGKRWALEINAWTPSIRWALAFDPGAEAAVRGEVSDEADEAREPREPDLSASDSKSAPSADERAGDAAGSAAGPDVRPDSKPRAKPGESSRAGSGADAKQDQAEPSTPPARKRRAPGTAIPRDAKDKSADGTKEQGGGGKQ